jgi:hypothetical protein
MVRLLGSRRAAAALAGLVAALASLVPWAVCSADHAYPRIGNLFEGDVRLEYAPALSKWDVVGLNVTVQDHLPQLPGQLRALNPEIVLLVYFPVAFVWSRSDTASPTVGAFLDKIESTDWWLYDDRGNRVGQEGYLWYINLTSRCHADGSGQIAAEWLAHYVASQVMGSGYWDGTILDGMSEQIRWLNNFDMFFQEPPAMVDSDRDGLADNPDSLDAWWKQGMEVFLATLRQDAGASAIIIPNGNNTLYQHANGGIREDFPHMHGGWQQNMFAWYGYIPMCHDFSDVPMNLTMMLCYWRDGEQDVFNQPPASQVDRFMRFTLASALLGDGYYFFDGGSGGSIWWQDQYDLDLGGPLAPAYLDSVESSLDHVKYPVWRRDFENATVICNPYQQWIVLDDGAWLFPEDGLIRTHILPGPLGVAIDKPASAREFHQRDRTILLEAEVSNQNAKAAQGYVWLDLMDGPTTLVSSMPREILIGVQKSDTLTLGLRVPATLTLGTYTVRVSVGGYDRIATGTDTMYVTRVIAFDRGGKVVVDENSRGCIAIGQDSLVIYPQPLVLSQENALSLDVKNAASATDLCSIKIYDAAGRLVSTVFEGRLDQGVVLDIGSEEGIVPRAPGIYFLHVETRDKATTRKIVLLR